MKQNDWPKMKNSLRFIKMTERTAKMTQSRGDVDVWSRLARSEPRWLDWGCGLDRGHGSTWVVRGSTRGARRDRTGARGMARSGACL
jgi:hypothetical protein